MSSASKKLTGNNYLVIYNPLSGPKRFGISLDHKIKRFLERHGAAFDFYYLIPGEAVPVEDLVKKYKPDYLIVAGGDGTLRSVCEKIYWAEIDLPIAFFPLGSANVFAMMIGVSQNLKYLLKPQTRDLYPGIFNDKKLFLIAACFGQIATMATSAHKYHKKLLGPFAYLLSILHRSTFFRHRKIHLGGKTTMAHSVAFCTSDFTKKLLPNIESADKKLTTITIKNKYAMGIIEMIFAKGFQNKPHRHLDIKLAESIAFCGFPQDEVHLDGDIFAEHGNKYRLEVAKRPLRFLLK